MKRLFILIIFIMVVCLIGCKETTTQPITQPPITEQQYPYTDETGHLYVDVSDIDLPTQNEIIIQLPKGCD